MHIEFLIEDKSGEAGLRHLVPRILNDSITWKIHSYRGVGRVPKNMTANSDPKKRFLLDQIFRLLRGYGKAFAQYPSNYRAAVIIVCDLDSRNQSDFKQEIQRMIDSCNPRPTAFLTLAVEEFEAWLLGDKSAIVENFPGAKQTVLNRYQYDSICGTWELLADAIYPGGSENLKSLGYASVGGEKIKWAETLCPVLSVDGNQSPSFRFFRDIIRGLNN